MPNSPRRRTHRPVGRLDGKALPDFGEQLLRRAPVQVAQHAVVVEDGHLVMREEHREEIAVRAGVAAARLGHARRRGRAVVAVGDVERRQRVEGARQRGDRRRVVDHPHLVAHAVVGRHIDVGRAGGAPSSMASISGAGGYAIITGPVWALTASIWRRGRAP